MKVEYQSPIGTILIEGGVEGIAKLVFADEMTSNRSFARIKNIDNQSDKNSLPSEMTSHWILQLDEYFNCKRKVFDLPLEFHGTDFQKRVWTELLNIPYGKTISYKELALKLGDIKAIRAVAAANGANPVSIIVPCHRVIGSDGSLTGYAGGLWRKRWLLEFERGEQRLAL